MIYGYLRAIENCSPERDINMQKQLETMTNQGIEIIFQDLVTRKTTGNEQFNHLLDMLEENDIVVIVKLSRLAVSLSELSDICGIFSNKRAILKVLGLGEISRNGHISNEKWINALKEFEEDIRYEKICRGHLISRKNHQSNSAIPCGRPPKYSKKQLSEALKLRDRYSFQEIANITGICKSTLLNASKKMQI
ncbi:recombinase family protein [Ruminiclostridium josui]|uniref:recombinase family protein n=1 Tax=Ruminiclostridium josui TaxID=1499 RepID=UPI0004B80EB2|nr:recombinase family protein [Ruminiclostridium josui]